MADWRFIAQRATTGEWLHWALPLSGVEVTRALSAPGRLSGTLPLHQVDQIAQDGLPLLDPWGVYVWADDGEQIRGGGILHSVEYGADTARLDVAGWSTYPTGLPWSGGTRELLQVDPLDVVRKCWADAQAAPGGNLGVAVDPTTSSIRVGEPGWWEDTETGKVVPASAVKWTSKGPDSRYRHHEAEPVTLAWWAVSNVGEQITQMLKAAKADFLEETTRVGETITKRLRLGAIGARRDDLRLVVGENVATLPSGVVDGADVADVLDVRGAGEGKLQVRGQASAPSTRLRRVAVISDKTLTNATSAAAAARAALPRHRAAFDFNQLDLIEHPNAPLPSLEPGDSIRFAAHSHGMHYDGWVRITEVTSVPEQTAPIRLTIEPEVTA